MDQYLENCMTKRASKWVLVQKRQWNNLGGSVGLSGQLHPVDHPNKLLTGM